MSSAPALKPSRVLVGATTRKGDKRRRALGRRKRRGWRKNGKLMKLQPLDRQILV
jgi:hypothetical protein